MKEDTIVEDKRAKLDFSFDTKENNKEVISQKVEEISQKAGFNTRISSKSEDSVIPQKMDRRTRTRTGRTYAFNTKIKPETYAKIAFFSDQMSDEEGRYVSLAEIIEKSVDALEEHFKNLKQNKK